MNLLRLSLLPALLALTAGSALAQNTHTVTVGPKGTFTFEPQDLTLNVGDTVLWVWDGIAGHSVSADSGAFQSAIVSAPNTFSVTFDASGQVSLSVSIPAGLAGTTVHLHAAELFGGGGILTNPVSVTL